MGDAVDKSAAVEHFVRYVADAWVKPVPAGTIRCLANVFASEERPSRVLDIQKNGLEAPERQALEQSLAEIHGMFTACISIGATCEGRRELIDVSRENHSFASEAYARHKNHGFD